MEIGDKLRGWLRLRGELREDPMLVIAILVLMSVIATTVALIAASPLFRCVTMAIDSWADTLQGNPEFPR